MSEYTIVNGELYHYGVKGMKWGVRRYQNADGSLTPAGKKKYDRMSDDKLQKTLYKQVKRARSEQSNWSNQWNVRNTIGKHSKSIQEKYDKARNEHVSSDAYRQAVKRLNKLDKQYDQGKIDNDKYNTEYERIQKSIYRPDLDSSVTHTSAGRKYVKAYMDKYGKDLNTAYLKDLGYDEGVAREFTERILNANRKMLNGM